MGPLGTLLTFPVSAPLGAVGWLARQIAEAAVRELLDPARIETALLVLARRLESGEIDEPAFEEEEARLLAELIEMRALRDGGELTEPESPDPEEPVIEPNRAEPEAGPWTAG